MRYLKKLYPPLLIPQGSPAAWIPPIVLEGSIYDLERSIERGTIIKFSHQMPLKEYVRDCLAVETTLPPNPPKS